jgi:hypothetical protein
LTFLSSVESFEIAHLLWQSQFPQTQQAAVVDKPGKDAKVQIKEIPVEEPQEEVLVKMEATGSWRPIVGVFAYR